MKKCVSSVCDTPGQLLELKHFGIDKTSAGGLNKKCKQCVAKLCRKNRSLSKLQKQIILDKKNAVRCEKINAIISSGTKYQSYQLEAKGQNMLIDAGKSLGVEVRQWQDGTRSDFGIRPLGCAIDLWLPQQLKVSSATNKPLTFYDCKGYECGIVCVAPFAKKENLYFFSPDFAKQNEPLLSGGSIRIGIRKSVWNSGECNIEHYFAEQIRIWNVGVGVYSERTLRLQATDQCVKEWKMREFAIALDSTAHHEDFEIRNGVCDRLMNGMRIQDKCASMNLKGGKSLIARVGHTDSSIAYSRGDNDFYCFHYVWEERNLYLQWMIPEEEMVRNGIVSEVDDTTKLVTKAGSGGIALHAASGTNDEETRVCIQRELLKGWPRKSKNPLAWTAPFLRTMKLAA
jgi:hypothetical protein